MTRTFRTIIGTALVLGALAAISPSYAHKNKPGANHDMMGMMGMMDQMTKMMTTCNRMMEMSMKGMDDSGTQMHMPKKSKKSN
jgi:hypothetical protein